MRWEFRKKWTKIFFFAVVKSNKNANFYANVTENGISFDDCFKEIPENVN